MGISDKMSQFAGQVQDGVKNTSRSLLTLSIKVITAFVWGLTLALVGQEVLSYGTILFIFMMITTGAVVFRISKAWSLGGILIFDLICVLVALLLRMYILVAP